MNNYDNTIYQGLENEFFDDLKNTQRVILCIGQKGSGKTTLFNSYLKKSLLQKNYDTYHLIIPSYKYEKDGSYNFLENQYNCFIYPSYTENVSKRVLDDRAKGNKCLFMIDDASGFDMNDENFKTLVVTSRHGKSKNFTSGGVCIFICLHSARAIIKPIVRNNCDYIFIFKMNNRKLLESLFQEYFSMVYNKFIDFLNVYKNAMTQKYNSILYSNQSPYLDVNVVNWDIIEEMLNVNKLPQQGRKREIKRKDDDEKPKHKLNMSTIRLVRYKAPFRFKN